MESGDQMEMKEGERFLQLHYIVLIFSNSV